MARTLFDDLFNRDPSFPEPPAPTAPPAPPGAPPQTRQPNVSTMPVAAPTPITAPTMAPTPKVPTPPATGGTFPGSAYTSSSSPGPDVPNGGGGDNGNSSGGGCDCTHYAYEKGHPCYDQCSGGGTLSDHDWYTREIASKPDVYDTGISEAQWIAWRKFWDEATHSFRNENVDAAGNPIGGTGYSKPVDCPEGTTKYNQNQCLPLSDPRVGGGGGGGGGGAAGAGGGGKSAPIAPGAGSTDFNSYLEKFIKDALNSPSRYTPEALQSLYGEITRQSAGAVRRGERAVRANAAQRGMSRAGSTDAALRDVRNQAESQRGQNVVAVQVQKINADFSDKMAALDRAQKFLDDMRDNEYRYMLANEQRRQFDANLTLAYANLAQQRSNLMAQLQSQWDMLRYQYGLNFLNQGA